MEKELSLIQKAFCYPRAEKAFISETRYTWISRMEKTPSAEEFEIVAITQARAISIGGLRYMHAKFGTSGVQ